MRVTLAIKINMMKHLLRFFTLVILFSVAESCSLLSAAGITSQGQPVKEVEGTLTSTTANSSVNVDHAQWDALLKKHVNDEIINNKNKIIFNLFFMLKYSCNANGINKAIENPAIFMFAATPIIFEFLPNSFVGSYTSIN